MTKFDEAVHFKSDRKKLNECIHKAFPERGQHAYSLSTLADGRFCIYWHAHQESADVCDAAQEKLWQAQPLPALGTSLTNPATGDVFQVIHEK